MARTFDRRITYRRLMCSQCDRVIGAGACVWRVVDGDRVVYVHENCWKPGQGIGELDARVDP